MTNYPIISQHGADALEPITGAVTGFLSAIPNAISAPFIRSKIIDGQLTIAIKEQDRATKKQDDDYKLRSQIINGINNAIQSGNFTPEVQAFYAMLWANIK